MTAARLIVAILALAGLVAGAGADGKYFGRTTVADDPTMPSQRAILAWRDGTQTLVIESAVEAEGDELGWVVPLPGVPTEIAATTAGALATLESICLPRIHTTRDADGWIQLAGIACVLSVAFGLIAAGKGRAGMKLLAGLLLALLVAALFLPALAKAGSSSVASAAVASVTRAGRYDVTVLHGSGADVASWLTGNGFACDDDARRVIDEYAAEGWAFAAMRVAIDVRDTIAPHPLRLTCAAEAPVYPMRLTGVGQARLALDLYVVANAPMDSPHMAPWWTGTLSLSDEGDSLVSEVHRAEIASPAFRGLAWDACTLTRLHGELTAADMRSDVRPSPVRRAPAVGSVWERGAPLRIALAVTALLASILFAVFIGAPALRAWLETRKALTCGAVLVVAAAPALVALSLPTVRVTRDRLSLRRVTLVEQVMRVAGGNVSLAELKADLAHLAEDGRLIPDHDGPFGYSIDEPADGAWSFTIVDRTGRPHTVRRSPPDS